MVNASELTQVACMVGMDLPAAILLNVDDSGFGFFEIDLPSIKVFEESLSKVSDPLDRSVVISNVIAMMRQLSYPATRMPIIMHQLLKEDNINLISAMTSAFHLAQTVFLPHETKQRFNKEIAQFFFKKVRADRGKRELQLFCIEKALPFVTEKEHLRICADLVKTGFLVI
jgi:hypothetical protein